MTTTAVGRTVPRSQANTLRTLAGIEARRYARHPLFLIGVALLAGVTVSALDELDATVGDAAIVPAFFLGVLGVFVGLQLTRSMDRSTEAVQASPADGVLRTAALCVACLVPGTVALAWIVGMYAAMAARPIPDSPAFGPADLALMLLVGVVCAVGGPLCGVLVGRWTRFAGSGFVTAVVLCAWAALATSGQLMPDARIGSFVRLNAPFTLWTLGGTGEPDSMMGGSPGWYLVYIVLLCGLAAVAAVLHEARGSRRLPLARGLAILAALAVASLTLAATADPTWIPL